VGLYTGEHFGREFADWMCCLVRNRDGRRGLKPAQARLAKDLRTIFENPSWKFFQMSE